MGEVVIHPDKLKELEAKHPGAIIVGTVNNRTGLKSVVYFAPTDENVRLLEERFGFGKELHGAVIHLSPPRNPEETIVPASPPSEPPPLTKRGG
ncbi:MAG: hypothetical protein ACRD0K_17765 [Egibacteraceae bacterium]